MSRAVKTASLRRQALRWRALSTSTNPLLNPVSDEPPPPHSLPDRRGVPHGVHRRMIFVRPWDGIPTMAHAFAIVRDIERRFGKIQDFVIVRDADVLSSFSPFLHATFSREEDADAIPLDGKVIQVVAPDVDEGRDGGIGLDDLHVYLNPETREQVLLDRESVNEREPESGPPEGKVIDVKLERTGLRDPPAVLDQTFGFGRRGPPHLNNPIRTQELAYAINAFGGFVNRPSHTQRRQTSMEAVVSRWSRMVKQPPQPRPVQVQVQENIVDENVVEKSEDPPPENQDIQWTPFEAPSVAPSLTPQSPITHIGPLSPSKPTLEAVNDNQTSKSNPTVKQKSDPKSEQKSEPKITTAEPRTSRKQRMLNAARLAGAMAASQPPDTSKESVGARPQATSPALDAAAEQANTEVGPDPKVSQEENVVAARKWWNFLTSGN